MNYNGEISTCTAFNPERLFSHLPPNFPDATPVLAIFRFQYPTNAVSLSSRYHWPILRSFWLCRMDLQRNRLEAILVERLVLNLLGSRLPRFTLYFLTGEQYFRGQYSRKHSLFPLLGPEMKPDTPDMQYS